jgi:type III pantothenate kinase
MLLAIDAGNTDIKFGIHDSGAWLGIWRVPTSDLINAADATSWMLDNIKQAVIEGKIDSVAAVSVVPSVNRVIDGVSQKLTGKEAFFVSPASVQSLQVFYKPSGSLGADRLASALGALAQFTAPLIVLDFGSATTIDVITGEGFLGGAILPGVRMQMESLFRRTEQLPEVGLAFPPNAIGSSTEHCIQSGILFGHLAAVEGMIDRFTGALKEKPTVVATGGLSHLFIGTTSKIHHFVSALTLDGVVKALGDGG